MKKLIALVLCLMLFAPALAFAAELVYTEDGKHTTAVLPVSAEPINLTGFGERFDLHGDWNEMPFFKALEELTNVYIEWETVSSEGYADKKTLKFAAYDFADVLFRAQLNSNDIKEYGIDSDGSIGLLKLNDLIDQYGANIQALYEAVPYAKIRTTQVDGNIYTLPLVEEATDVRMHMLWINQSWLDNLGLTKPETTDELLDVLRAFVTQDPNQNGVVDEIGWSDFSNSIGRILAGIMGSFGCGNISWGMHPFNYNAETDSLEYFYNTENWKECLKFVNTCYAEGLLDPDYFTNTAPRYVSLLAEDRLGLLSQCHPHDAGKNWYKWDVLYPPTSAVCDKPILTSVNSPVVNPGTFAISCTNPYPVETFKMVDFLYSDEGYELYRFGGLQGVTYDIDEKGYYYTSYTADNYVYEATSGKEIATWGDVTPYYGGATPTWAKDNNTVDKLFPVKATSALGYAMTQVLRFAQAQHVENYLGQVYGSLNYTEEELEQRKLYTDNAAEYVSDMNMKFITGEASFDQWDEFVSNLNGMYLKEFVDATNSAFDRVK